MSESGRYIILPISFKVNPALAPFYKAQLAILKLRRHSSLRLNFDVNIFRSDSIFIELIKSRLFWEKGYSAYSHHIQFISSTDNVKQSGKDSP